MISKITRAYVRRYTDNGMVQASVDWVDDRGRKGRTQGTAYLARNPSGATGYTFGTHMHALFARAKREGLRLQRETW